ncbi:MAG: glycosyltransferase family 4 protein [Eubacterium sp.]|nr:glycosyltransferase family 4 protein [Eubacterium sp.]
MNILYIAYSCDPYCGSEDKIGWNIPLEASKTHQVFVLTKEEHRQNITKYCSENKIENLSFFFIDINGLYKKVFKPPFYSGRLNIWHKKAFSTAKKICLDNNISIIHQIAPIEFRSIGKYYKIPNTKFICGPIAGSQDVPKALFNYLGKEKPIERIRMIINRFYRFKLRLSGILNKCDCVLYANNETKDFLEPSSNRIVIPDTALKSNELSPATESPIKKDEFIFLTASRLTATKGLGLLFDSMKQLPESPGYKLRIVGEGPLENEIKSLFASDDKVIKHTQFLGKLPFSEMNSQYQRADAFVFPSFREASGSVILEAMANGIPVITENRCGGAVICSDECAYLYNSANTKDEYIDNLSSVMLQCVNNQDEVRKKGETARKIAEKFTFEERIKTYTKIYEEL